MKITPKRFVEKLKVSDPIQRPQVNRLLMEVLTWSGFSAFDFSTREFDDAALDKMPLVKAPIGPTSIQTIIETLYLPDGDSVERFCQTIVNDSILIERPEGLPKFVSSTIDPITSPDGDQYKWGRDIMGIVQAGSIAAKALGIPGDKIFAWIPPATPTPYEYVQMPDGTTVFRPVNK